jgi:dienelactone hydrolase
MTKFLLTIAVLAFAAVAPRAADAQIIPSLPVLTYTSGGTTIHVEVATATGTGVHPSVIFLYGENGEVGLFPWNYAYIGSWFASQGFNCFVVHYLDKAFPVPGLAVFGGYLQVINDGTTWAMSQPGVDPARITIVGLSLGASLGISEAARDLRIKALAAWSGSEAVWYENLTRYTITHMPPTILVHGALDTVSTMATVNATQTLIQGLGVPCQLDIFPNEKHAFTGADELTEMQQTLAFFKSYLGG